MTKKLQKNDKKNVKNKNQLIATELKIIAGV